MAKSKRRHTKSRRWPAKSKRKHTKSRKKGGGYIWNNLKKNFTIFKKDPVNITRFGRETDLKVLLTLYSKDEWRNVKRHLLAMSKKPETPLNENDNIFQRAKAANINLGSPSPNPSPSDYISHPHIIHPE